MKSLLIDTSSFFVTIALLENEKTLDIYQENITGDMASMIISQIDKIVSKNNTPISDIKRIYVINGPGSFTGIRIGVSIAKTLGWAKKIDLIPISSLELLATTNTATDYNIGLIDARRGNVFAGVYDGNLNCILNDQLIELDKIINQYPIATLISVNDINNSIFPKYDIEKLIKKHENDTPVNPHKLNPNYLKLTEAEENKNKQNDKENN